MALPAPKGLDPNKPGELQAPKGVDVAPPPMYGVDIDEKRLLLLAPPVDAPNPTPPPVEPPKPNAPPVEGDDAAPKPKPPPVAGVDDAAPNAAVLAGELENEKPPGAGDPNAAPEDAPNAGPGVKLLNRPPPPAGWLGCGVPNPKPPGLAAPKAPCTSAIGRGADEARWEGTADADRQERAHGRQCERSGMIGRRQSIAGARMRPSTESTGHAPEHACSGCGLTPIWVLVGALRIASPLAPCQRARPSWPTYGSLETVPLLLEARRRECREGRGGAGRRLCLF
eukprot:365535-Chlamydomonas_euryale.AAC.4